MLGKCSTVELYTPSLLFDYLWSQSSVWDVEIKNWVNLIKYIAIVKSYKGTGLSNIGQTQMSEAMISAFSDPMVKIGTYVSKI